MSVYSYNNVPSKEDFKPKDSFSYVADDIFNNKIFNIRVSFFRKHFPGLKYYYLRSFIDFFIALVASLFAVIFLLCLLNFLLSLLSFSIKLILLWFSPVLISSFMFCLLNSCILDKEKYFKYILNKSELIFSKHFTVSELKNYLEEFKQTNYAYNLENFNIFLVSKYTNLQEKLEQEKLKQEKLEQERLRQEKLEQSKKHSTKYDDCDYDYDDYYDDYGDDEPDNDLSYEEMLDEGMLDEDNWESFY